jgi:ATP-binding protein involved in chromosome partitioning
MNFKSVIAVASGKGGVGKSTTSVNLAVSLQKQGASVGLLDADVYGPNIPMMMGVPEDRPTITDTNDLIPFVGYGVKVMSVAFLVDPGKAVIWRGPMMHNMIRQFLTKVAWGDLDYLIVDLPPTTGDAPLSLVQTVPITGAIIVTTPQQVALSDVRRSISMFQEVKVPILGLIENMSGFYCDELKKVVPMFRGEGGKRLSQEYDIPLLGQIPFDPAVSEGGDRGAPAAVSMPDSVQGKAFQEAALHVAQRVKELQTAQPTIEIS